MHTSCTSRGNSGRNWRGTLRCTTHALPEETETEGNSAFRSSYPPGLVPHQKTSAPAPIRRSHADILGDACGKRKKNRGKAMLVGRGRRIAARRCLRVGHVVLCIVGEWQRGWVVIVVEAFWWWCCVWSKITTEKEKRPSEDRSPYKSHIFPLYNGMG